MKTLSYLLNLVEFVVSYFVSANMVNMIEIYWLSESEYV